MQWHYDHPSFESQHSMTTFGTNMLIADILQRGYHLETRNDRDMAWTHAGKRMSISVALLAF